jgi:hypothetical protein
MGRWAIDFAQFSLGLFDELVLGNQAYGLHPQRHLLHRTYSIGLVDELCRVNFYDGRVSVVDPTASGLASLCAG